MWKMMSVNSVVDNATVHGCVMSALDPMVSAVPATVLDSVVAVEDPAQQDI
jgi:hypothetical protein